MSGMTFFVPSFRHYESAEADRNDVNRFAVLSVTGARCNLSCEHCRGRLLERMIPALAPGDLLATAERLSGRGCKGLLISGGSSLDGEVPLLPFVDAMAEIKCRLGMKLCVHTGYAGRTLSKALAGAGVDGVMLDVIGDDETLQSVYHLRGGTDLIRRSLSILREDGVRTIPHVVAGLHHGEIRSEMKALELVSECDPHAVVIVILSPLRGTPMAGAKPPSAEDLTFVFRDARARFPDVPLMLGCARPGGRLRKQYDLLALASGFDAIAFPSDEAVRRARQNRTAIAFRSECCALITAEPIR